MIPRLQVEQDRIQGKYNRVQEAIKPFLRRQQYQTLAEMLETYVMGRSWREWFLDQVLALEDAGTLGKVKDFYCCIMRGEPIEMEK